VIILCFLINAKRIRKVEKVYEKRVEEHGKRREEK